MKQTPNSGITRRELIQTSGKIAVASALAGVAIPHVHAAENNTIQVALVGCGGRGTGAAHNALSVKNGPDQAGGHGRRFPDRLSASYKNLREFASDQVDVPEDRQFIGFDGYRKAMDCLQAGRRGHLRDAARLPLGPFHLCHPEGPQRLHGEADHGGRPEHAADAEAGARNPMQKNLKVGVGLMCRHCDARGELYKRIKDGQIGDIVLLRAYRMARPGRLRLPPAPSPTTSASCSTRSATSTPSCGPAAAATAISSSTTSTSAAG